MTTKFNNTLIQYYKGWEDCLAAQKKIKDALIPHGYVAIDGDGYPIDASDDEQYIVKFYEDDIASGDIIIRPFRFMK